MLGISLAFVFIQLWMWSAESSWSSDDWVLAIPVVLVVASFLAVVAIVVRVVWPRK